jgi:predicted transposase/invertase (TIGR01784 family)
MAIIIPPDADILPPSDDRIFKTVLTHPHAERVLIDVVSAVTGHNIVKAQVQNNELPVNDTKEKSQRFDVNCTVIDNNGKERQINVEMQGSLLYEIPDDNLNFKSKYAYYGMDLFTSQPSVGVDYADLMQTYQITFCNYTVFPDRQDFVHEIALRFPDGEVFCDLFHIVVIEMSKLDYTLNKRVENLTGMEMWGLFFGYAQDPRYREIINNIIKTKEEVGMATELLLEVSKDAEERARIRSQKKFLTDEISNRITAQKLIAEGKAEERRKNVEHMYGEGFSVAQIARGLGLPEKDVNEILGL